MHLCLECDLLPDLRPNTADGEATDARLWLCRSCGASICQHRLRCGCLYDVGGMHALAVQDLCNLWDSDPSIDLGVALEAMRNHVGRGLDALDGLSLAERPGRSCS